MSTGEDVSREKLETKETDPSNILKEFVRKFDEAISKYDNNPDLPQNPVNPDFGVPPVIVIDEDFEVQTQPKSEESSSSSSSGSYQITESGGATKKSENPKKSPDSRSQQDENLRSGPSSQPGMEPEKKHSTPSGATSNIKWDKIPVAQVYKDKVILITGATGFLGKVLLAKLMRSCPRIRAIYLLLRPKDDRNVEERFFELLGNQIFDDFKNDIRIISKIQMLRGDVSLPNLGLDEVDLSKVLPSINFVFHCAANVRFEDDPRTSFTDNILGMKNVIDLCHKIKFLDALVHVSSAYSFCNRQVIGERIYPEITSPDDLIEVLEWTADEIAINLIREHMLEGRPSLYHFSKAMAEILLVETEPYVPAIIVRPSIITASYKEPFPGWIDNFYGPSGFLIATGKGIVRTLLIDPAVHADWVPVDIVANTLIVAAYRVAMNNTNYYKCFKRFSLEPAQNVPIANCTCPRNKLMTWKQMSEIYLPLLVKYPSIYAFRHPGGIVTTSKLLHQLVILRSHFIPGVFADICSLVIGQKPIMLSAYFRFHRAMRSLQFFTRNYFSFTSKNMENLKMELLPRDKEEFYIDQCQMDWNEYAENYVLGLRRYVLMENDATLPLARKRSYRLYCAWQCLKLTSLIGFVYILSQNRHVSNFSNGLMNNLASQCKKGYSIALKIICRS